MYSKDILIDIETLGTSPGCIVLSICAVPLSIDDIENIDIEAAKSRRDIFYKTLDVNTSLNDGFSVDTATQEWWATSTSDEAKMAAYKNPSDPASVIVGLSNYIADIRGDVYTRIKIWGNPPRFDLGILEEYFDCYGIKVPWNHWEERDYRTVNNLCKVSVERTKPPANKEHIALYDALYEASHLKSCLEFMRHRGIV